jgi:rabconnectin-3a
VFPLDRQVLSQALASILDDFPLSPDNDKPEETTLDVDEKDQRRKLEEIRNEDWDLFLRIMTDGSVVIRGVAVRSHIS